MLKSGERDLTYPESVKGLPVVSEVVGTLRVSLNGHSDYTEIVRQLHPTPTEKRRQKMGPDVVYMSVGNGNYQLMWAFDTPYERSQRVYNLTIDPEGYLVLNRKRLRSTIIQ